MAAKKYRHKPEQYLQEEARMLIQGKPLSLLEWCNTPEGPEFRKPVWDILLASLATPGSDNWKPVAHLARLWAANGAARDDQRDELLAFLGACTERWMGDERGAIYFPHHMSLPIGAAKWARRERDEHLLAACADVILWAAAFRAAVTYKGACYWIGQRSAGINYGSDVGRSFGGDFDKIAAGELRAIPEGRRGPHWSGFDHVLHDCWQEVYEATKPLRDGEPPLDVMEDLSFRLLEPVYILQTTGGFATWEKRMRSGDTQAVLGVVKIDGRPARYLPAEASNQAKNRRKGMSSLTMTDNALLYRSAVYGEQEEPLPPGDPILYVEVGGRYGGVDDLLAVEDDDPPSPPQWPDDPPVEDDDPPADPEPDSKISWFRRAWARLKVWWAKR